MSRFLHLWISFTCNLDESWDRIMNELTLAEILNCQFPDDPAFNAFVDTIPTTLWAKRDLSAVRMGWEAYRKHLLTTVSTD